MLRHTIANGDMQNGRQEPAAVDIPSRGAHFMGSPEMGSVVDWFAADLVVGVGTAPRRAVESAQHLDGSQVRDDECDQHKEDADRQWREPERVAQRRLISVLCLTLIYGLGPLRALGQNWLLIFTSFLPTLVIMVLLNNLNGPAWLVAPTRLLCLDVRLVLFSTLCRAVGRACVPLWWRCRWCCSSSPAAFAKPHRLRSSSGVRRLHGAHRADAVSYIAAAGLEPQPASSNENSRVIDLRITVDGADVEVPAYVGTDRVRALQAPVHTHDTSGQVWLEGRETGAVTLGQFFTLWGVRFDDHCLGSACGALVVKVDGVATSAPREVRLATSKEIDITAKS
jgi:hypothetical protein